MRCAWEGGMKIGVRMRWWRPPWRTKFMRSSRWMSCRAGGPRGKVQFWRVTRFNRAQLLGTSRCDVTRCIAVLTFSRFSGLRSEECEANGVLPQFSLGTSGEPLDQLSSSKYGVGVVAVVGENATAFCGGRLFLSWLCWREIRACRECRWGSRSLARG